MIRVLCAALAAALLLSAPAAADASPPARTGENVSSRLVLRHVPGQTLPAELLATLGVERRTGTLIPGVVTLDLPERAQERVRARLARDERVAWVEPEAAVRAADRQPDDELWPQQWGSRTIGAPAAWAHTTGSSSVTVAILDTGVDSGHPELSGRVVAGRSFVLASVGTHDDSGHGTASAGVAAAQGDNGIGIAGMCWSCTILPVKVLNALGFGDTTQLAQGIRWAVDNGAQVVNLSLGAETNPRVLDEAVTYAVERGVVLVAAAGNGSPGSNQQFYPAADPRVLSVGATDANDFRYDFSNHTWVDVAAPGCNVTTLPLGRYDPAFCGTSSAAPLVSGAAALILSRTPSATPDQVRAALEATATPVDGFVHGRIDVARALARVVEAAQPPPPLVHACPPGGVPDAGFNDVRGNTHEQSISCIVWYGVAQGVGAGRYGPAREVTRGQMASFLARALERAGVQLHTSGDHFDDVAADPHRDSINKLANAGVVQGTGPRTYSPTGAVRRDQMASFLVRAYELAAREELDADGGRFADTRGNAHERSIDKAAEAGLVRGTQPARYEPARHVRRDQMGSFVARTLDLLVSRGHMQPN